MPAVPVIAAVTGASAAVGATVAAAVGLGTVGAVAATAIGTGIIAGATTAAMGGDASDVLESAVVGGVTSYVGGSVLPEVASVVTDATGSQIAGQAITSGLASEVQGGDFVEGALLGGISGAANEAKLAAAEEYLASQPSGYGAYESNLPTEQAVLDVIAAEQPKFTISDTAFTPDYSLTTGAPVIPEMGAQGIQVPTINEVIDVVSQPVDYSLPIPDSGLGFVMPTVPNIEDMGNGQGITIPVAEGTLTEAGVIPENYTPILGDAESFINQPAPDSGVTIPEVVETPMTADELLSKMTTADLIKTLGLTAATAYMADKYGPPEEEQITGFGIVPVPSEWQTPVYDQAFTPSSPIDFGSRELLRGTQWENPINLSSVINVLNQPMQIPGYEQPIVQMPTVGMNDIIGNLNGKPMSIADIISGIQSGQTYSS